MTSAPSALQCRAIGKQWGDQPVLVEVDFDLIAGEWLSVIGPNGAGKSTLLHALAGIIDYSGTVVRGDGEPTDPTDIALVPQKPLLPVGMTVAEYVLLGRTSHLGWLVRESRSDRDAVTHALRRLDLGRFAHRQLTDLSGGEAQRVVVARAMVQAAPIVLLDEPTTALDLGHQTAVLELMDSMRRADGISVLASVHDLGHAARFSDRILVLHQGRVVALGTPDEVLRSELLSEVYGTALRVHQVDGDVVVLPARDSTSRW